MNQNKKVPPDEPSLTPPTQYLVYSYFSDPRCSSSSSSSAAEYALGYATESCLTIYSSDSPAGEAVGSMYITCSNASSLSTGHVRQYSSVDCQGAPHTSASTTSSSSSSSTSTLTLTLNVTLNSCLAAAPVVSSASPSASAASTSSSYFEAQCVSSATHEGVFPLGGDSVVLSVFGAADEACTAAPFYFEAHGAGLCFQQQSEARDGYDAYAVYSATGAAEAVFV